MSNAARRDTPPGHYASYKPSRGLERLAGTLRSAPIASAAFMGEGLHRKQIQLRRGLVGDQQTFDRHLMPML